MSFAPGYAEPVPPMVSPYTAGWGFANEGNLGSAPVSVTWEAVDRAVYMPIFVPSVCVAKRVWWANGATVNASSTIEVGLYTDTAYQPAAKVISGSAAQGTASQIQFVDVTDTALWPGVWWIALMCSSITTTTLMRTSILAANVDELFRFQQASANPLPGTATPVETGASGIWLCGFSTTTIT